MKLREVSVKNFRCLVDVTVPITDTTVLVGENNSGKTALLDALGIALSRRPGGRASLFDEYDYHMVQASDSPQTSEGIVVELWFREDSPDDWPDSLVQALTNIVQTDPVEDIESIGLRLTSKFDNLANEMVTNFEFLSLDGKPLEGRGKDPRNLGRFRQYVLFSYLSAVRDSEGAFSMRSPYWGPILRDLHISEEQRRSLSEELSKLNTALLKEDPRLDQVVVTLNKVQEIMGLGTEQQTSIQALPLKPWDLMSKSEVVIKPRGSEIELPLTRHGQGMQSLAVLFLFQAFIEVLLKPSFQPETVAILGLEEPEAHLHPHATRALAANLNKIQSQKIIASHSPYFIQEIPFKEIRMLRRVGPSSKVLYIKESFPAQVPQSGELLGFVASNPSKFSYNERTSTLYVTGKMEEREYRDLLKIYPHQNDVHAEIKRVKDESSLYLDENDLNDLETFAKRIRGEVLFARAWLLCEGQSDYLLFRYFAELLGKPFDQAGITVIDFQNIGSPGTFIALARNFDIPLILICDNDDELTKIRSKAKSRGLTGAEIDEIVRPLPGEGVNIELFLLQNGFAKDYQEILSERSVTISTNEGEAGFEEEIASKLRKDKRDNAIALIEKLQEEGADESRVPPFIAKAINDIIEMGA